MPILNLLSIERLPMDFLCCTCIGIGAIFHGFDEGVEFKGGRSYISSL